jgi:phosphoglycerate dehydrogenase-like enzyme
MRRAYAIRVLNQISPAGLKRLPAERYAVGKDVAAPDAILVRSADLHALEIPASVQAIARAGAGTNNIPVAALSARGVAVFNAPGGNANAVKELVLAGMLMAARNLAPALRFVAGLDAVSPDLDKAVEEGKKAFAGFELAGHTLGIVGLGKVGCLVADQLRDYLEHGNVVNAVNFPAVTMARESAYRVAIANANVPNMLGQISTAMAHAGLNIHNMVNKSRGEMAYTLVDVDSAVGPEVLEAIRAIDGVLSVRYLPQGAPIGE